MAVPAFRGAGAAVFSANNVATPTALAPTKHASTVNGDLMLLVTECRSITATVATPTGWALLTGFPKRSATASGGSIYVFSRIADGTANDAPSVSWSGLTTGTTGDSCGARILSYSNATATQDGTVSVNDAASTTSITMPDITTSFDNSLVVGVAMRVNDTLHTFTVATRTERSDDHTTSGTGHGTETADLVKSPAGAAGTATVTPSNTTSSRTLAVTLAMRASSTVVALSAVTEADTAQALGRLKTAALGPASSIAAAQPFGRSKSRALGVASSAEVAASITPRKFKPLTAAAEADAAVQITRPPKVVAVGPALETDAARPLTAAKARAVTAALESGTAPAVGRRKSAQVSAAVSTAVAPALGRRKSLVLAPASETNLALALQRQKLRVTAPALETGTAPALGRTKRTTVSAATELDQALDVTSSGIHIAVGPATETAQARAIGRQKSRTVAAAVASEQARPLGRLKAASLAPALEADVAVEITLGGLSVPVSIAVSDQPAANLTLTDGASVTLILRDKVKTGLVLGDVKL